MRTNRTIVRLLVLSSVLAAAVALASCGGHVRYAYTSKVVFTLTNLHIDPRGDVWSANYIEGSLIPRCTPVLIEVVSRKKMVFTVQGTGARYNYIFHRAMGEDIPTHLNKYFGTACDAAAPSKLNEADQSGIRDGKLYAGMTKAGVIMAVGYPPPQRTASLDSDNWVYWKGRYGTVEVIFVNGAVQYLRE